jgi:hypothetical protein
MNEIKKTLEILKARWPETTLIIGFYILSLFVNKLLSNVHTKASPLLGLINFIFIIAFITIFELLIIGFQRTFYLEGQQRQSLIVLLRIGAHFFWRMVGIEFIFLFVFGVLAWITFFIIKQLLPIEAGFWGTYKNYPIVYQLCFTIPSLILIKPSLLIPTLIIVLDCRISQSFKLFRQFKLLDAKELVVLFLTSIAIAFLWIFLPSIESAVTISQFVLTVAKSIIQQFVSLMIVVLAVRFVTSRNLVYDNRSSSLNFQDLPKPLI